MSDPLPPRWLERLLRRALPPRDRDALAGDMAELFAARARGGGRARATWWYAKHTLRFAWTVRKDSGSQLRPLDGADPERRGGMMKGMGGEFTGAARRLVRAPVFAIVSTLIVAVGIGAFSSIYGVVDSVLLEPPPYRAPEQLQWIWRDYWFGLDRGWLGGPDIVHLREHDEAFEGVVALRSAGANLTGREGDNPRRISVLQGSAGLFELLGVNTLLGRGFAKGEDAPDAPLVTILGYDLWRDHFGGDRTVVGTELYLDGEAATVVGVAPPDFRFVMQSSLGGAEGADVYLPLRLDLASLDPGSGSFAGLARVRDGARPAVVDAAIAAVAKDLDDLWGNPGLKMRSVDLMEALVSPVRPALTAVLGAAVLLLLVLAANLATLLLGRASIRDRELAVRAALGAGRGRVVQSVLAEGVLIALVGGSGGLALAWLGTNALRTIAPPDLPRRLAIGLDPSVVGVAVAATIVMTLAAGVPASLRALGSGVAGRLREAGGRSAGGRSGTRTRSGLVVAQVAMSLLLLVGGALLTRAFGRLLQADPGFDGREALTFQVALTSLAYPGDGDVVEFDRRLRVALLDLPGVRAAGAATELPLSTDASQTDIAFPDAAAGGETREERRPLIDYVFAGTGYAEAVGLRLRGGRFFTTADDASAPPVVIIDDLLADRFYPNGGALGQRAVFAGDTLTVVGVVDQARLYTVHSDDRPQVYLPLAQRPRRTLSYVVDAESDPSTLTLSLRRAIDAVDPAVPMSRLRTLDGIIDASLGRERLSLTLLLGFAAGALLLATLGLYGVVSNGVTRRTHEMGVRMALGADRRGVVGLVLRQGLRLTAWGTLLGLGGAVAVSSSLRGIMAGVEPNDPFVYVGVTLLLGAVAAVAVWIPARRATRIDPVEALRAE